MEKHKDVAEINSLSEHKEIDGTASNFFAEHTGTTSKGSIHRKILFLIVGLLFVILHRRPPSNAQTLRYAQEIQPSVLFESKCNSFSTTSKFAFASSGPRGWPSEVCTVQINSTLDHSLQPSLHYAPSQTEDEGAKTKGIGRPLLVALHTWSSTYRQPNGGEMVYAKWAVDHGWHFLHPHFRGPNRSPEACGSKLAIQDVIDAVDFVTQHYKIDTDRIYLAGVSGGGHMATLLAGRHPFVWAGVSAWAPITDLRSWWIQRHGMGFSKTQITGRRYARNIEHVLGGKPDGSNLAALQASRERSPVTHLEMIEPGSVNLDLNAGFYDGRSGGAVPFSHALHGFDAAVKPLNNGTIGVEAIEAFYETMAPPEGYKGPSSDTLYGARRIHFRRISNTTRVTVFEGGHEILHLAALNWLKRQRRGQPADFSPVPESEIDWIDLSPRDSLAGK